MKLSRSEAKRLGVPLGGESKPHRALRRHPESVAASSSCAFSGPLRITLPWPPSTNHIWRNYRGRMVLSAAGRAYHSLVMQAVMLQRANVGLAGRLVVLLELHAPTHDAAGRRRTKWGDVANREKVLIDSLQGAGCFRNDEQIDDLRIVRREPVSGGAVVVTIQEVDKEQK